MDSQQQPLESKDNKDDKEMASEEERSCSICREVISVTDRAHLVPCNHIFHDACITNWFGQNRNTCPECRTVATQVNFNFHQNPAGFETREVPEPEPETGLLELRLGMVSVGGGVFAYNLFPIPVVELISVHRPVTLVYIHEGERRIEATILANQAHRLTHQQLTSAPDYVIDDAGTDHNLVQPLIQLFTSQLQSNGQALVANAMLPQLQDEDSNSSEGENEMDAISLDDSASDITIFGSDGVSEETFDRELDIELAELELELMDPIGRSSPRRSRRSSSRRNRRRRLRRSRRLLRRRNSRSRRESRSQSPERRSIATQTDSPEELRDVRHMEPPLENISRTEPGPSRETRSFGCQTDFPDDNM